MQDRQIDARVLATLSFHDLVPTIWLPTPELRRERERSRWRLHVVKHRSTLKNRVHSTLMTFGHQVPIADLFGLGGRKLLRELDIPDSWRGHVDASVELIDELSCGSLRSSISCSAPAPTTATSRGA